MWPFKPSVPKPEPRTYQAVLTDCQTLMVAALLDATYALPDQQRHAAKARLWQTIHDMVPLKDTAVKECGHIAWEINSSRIPYVIDVTEVMS